MFKYNKEWLPKSFNSLFNIFDTFHTYDTRNKENYRIKLKLTSMGQQSIAYRGPKLWNQLARSIRECTNISTFKKELLNKNINDYKQKMYSCENNVCRVCLNYM